MERLTVPAVDALLVGYLRTELAATYPTVHVSTTIPNPRPPLLVRVMLVGGAGRFDVTLHRATVAIEAWAPDVPTASDLARLADALLYAAPDSVAGLYAVQPVGAVQAYPDVDTGSPRYTAAYDVVVRAAA